MPDTEQKRPADAGPVDCLVRPLRDLTRETWANPERMPYMVRAVVRAEVAATARTALRAAIALLAVYLLVEGLKLWAAA